MSEKPTDSSDVQTILANLQEEIRQHRLALGELGAIERPDPLAQVRKHAWVNSHLPIGWPVMPKGILAKFRAYTQKIVRRLLRWYINPIVEQQNSYNAAVTEALGQTLARIDEQTQHQRGLEDAIKGLGGDQRELLHEQEVARLRLQRLENWHRDNTPAALPPEQNALAHDNTSVDYFVLGAEHRSEVQLATRLQDYDDLFDELKRNQVRGTEPVRPVLDIGCGRGDLVEHLGELGLKAYGIDIDADALSIALAKGRSVQQAGALAHLADVDDSSLAAITLIQVIEHFSISELLDLFRLAHRKLAPGGFIVAETINALCLVALTNAYLLDPSHRALLHPQMTRFLMEQAGFWQVQLRFLRPVADAGRLQRLSALSGAIQEALSTMNGNIDKLNDLLYGPQDYAAIAYRPKE